MNSLQTRELINLKIKEIQRGHQCPMATHRPGWQNVLKGAMLQAEAETAPRGRTR